MTTDPTTSRHNPMKVIFNYQNVFFSFFYDDADACVHRSTGHRTKRIKRYIE